MLINKEMEGLEICMKKLLVLILIPFLTFIIYKANDDNLIDYMSLGDSIDLGINSYQNKSFGYNDYLKTYLENNKLLHKSNFFYSKEDYKIGDLVNDIKNNKKVLYDDRTYNIKKELRESDLITIAIGMDELTSLLTENKDQKFKSLKPSLDNLISEMDELLEQVSSLSKGKIILIGYYNPYGESRELTRIFAYLFDAYQELAKKYSLTYLDIYNMIKQEESYLPNKNDYHLTSKGYLKIASEIIKLIEDDL